MGCHVVHSSLQANLKMSSSELVNMAKSPAKV